MTGKSKTIRVFVSSTFKDMQCERDYLATVVFPGLKDKCLRAGLNFIDIDLRWGVPEEKERERSTLEILFEEIDKCHPYFIGLLGERFGSNPHSNDIPKKAHAVLRKKIEEKNSFTALEIYYAFLKKKGFCQRAFFYFRNPIPNIPDLKSDEFRDKSKQKQLKLKLLKEFIETEQGKYHPTKHIYPYSLTYKGLTLSLERLKGTGIDAEQEKWLKKFLKENQNPSNSTISKLGPGEKNMLKKYGSVMFDNLQGFGESVEHDLWEAIKSDIPVLLEKTPPELVERSFHQHFILSLTRHFYGRKNELKKLAAYILNNDNQPVVVTGSAGSGKSAVMAKLFNQLEELPGHNTFLLPHFVGASPDSTDLFKTIKRLLIEIGNHFGIGIERIPDEFNELKERFFEILFSAGKKSGKKIVILIDGVNQFSRAYDPWNFSWLPKKLPPDVKIILSLIDDTGTKEKNVKWISRIRKLGLKEYRISKLPIPGRNLILRSLFKIYGKSLPKSLLLSISKKTESYKPLYLKIIIEELRLFPDRKLLAEKVSSLPGNIQGLFGEVLARIEKEHNKYTDVVKNSLSFIECSRSGLQETELMDLCDYSKRKIPKLIWLEIYWGLRPYLQTLGDEREGNIAFFHKQLSKSVRERYLTGNDREVRIYNIFSGYGLNIFNQLNLDGFKGGNDSLNCFWDLGIYIVKSGKHRNLTELTEVLRMIFLMPDERQKFFVKIPDNLIFYIRNESDSSIERSRFRKVFTGLCKGAVNEDLAKYLVLKGGSVKSTGSLSLALWFFRWAENIFKNSLKINQENNHVLRSLSVIYNKTGEIKALLNKRVEAIADFNKDLRICRKAFIKSAKADNEGRDLLTSLNTLGDYFVKLNDFAEAGNYFNEAIEISRKIYEADQEDAGKGFDYTMCLIKYGDLQLHTSRTPDALSGYKEAAEIRNEIFKKDPLNADKAKDLSVCYEKISDACLQFGNSPDALKFQILARNTFHSFYEMDWRNENKANVFSLINERLGKFYILNGNEGEAERSLKEALEIRTKIYQEDIDNIEKSLNYSRSLNKLGDLYLKTGDHTKSGEFYLRALNIRKELNTIDPQDSKTKRMLSESYIRLGILRAGEGVFRESQIYYMEAKKILCDLIPEDGDHKELARELSILYQHFGNMYSMEKEFLRAIGYYRKSLKIAKKLVRDRIEDDEYTKDLAVVYVRLGDASVLMQKPSDARAFYINGCKLLNLIYEKDPENAGNLKDLSVCANKLGDILLENDKEEAMGYYTTALNNMIALYSRDRTSLVNSRDLSICYEKTGNWYFSMQQFEEALKNYLLCLELREGVFDKLNQSFNDGISLAAIYYRAGKTFAIINRREEGRDLVMNGLTILGQFENDGKFVKQPEYLVWIDNFNRLLKNMR